jgi:hypothetical protein
MNSTIKTVLSTLAVLSLVTIAMIEISGISRTALYNKFNKPEVRTQPGETIDEKVKRVNEVKTMPKTTYEFESSKADLGDMVDGEVKQCSYTVKNTGNAPLLIGDVHTSCGCTAPSFPKAPIAPGATGVVTLEFNSAGKEGKVEKNALVELNADYDKYSIGFTANVLPKK